jgi:Right handed beta helix region
MTIRSMKLAVLGLPWLLVSIQQAQAQSTRTFISGLGSDANPCTRALPCQTLANALPNTASGGEIYVLDAAELVGGPAVTITKSVSIIGAGARGGVTSAALIVSPPAGGQVVLKGLDINANGGGAGVSVTTSVGISLVIEDCTIFNAIGSGINFTPQPGTAPSYLFVRNSTIYNNRGGFTGAGIFIQPGSTAPSIAVLDGVHVNGNGFGVWAFAYTNVTIRNSVVSQSTASGIRADSSTGPATILVEHSQSSHNAGNGVIAVGAAAIARITDVTITDNVNGVIAVTGGQVISFGNNSIDGNVNNGAPTSTISLK